MHRRILAHLQRWDQLAETGARIWAHKSDCPWFPPLQLQPLGCNLINVPSDHHGMVPSALQDILSRWDPLEVHKPRSSAPKVLYTIPNGGNPTGASMTAERKQEVYKVSLIPPSEACFFLLCLYWNCFPSWPSSTTCSSSRMTHTTSCSLTRYSRLHVTPLFCHFNRKRRTLTSDMGLSVLTRFLAAVGSLFSLHGCRRENHQDGLLL